MATEQQVPKLVSGLVEHQNAFAVLSVEDAQWVITNTKDAIAIACTAIANRTKVATQVVVQLLQLLGEVAFPGAKNLVASEHFVKHPSRNAKVKIAFIGDNFKAWFLGKTEDNVPAGVFQYTKLLHRSLDSPIIASLGGEEKAETSLAEVFYLMSIQPNGEEGVLLTNGYANIFYVRDSSGTLRVVDVRWHGDGWLVNADEVSRPDEWSDGNRVFSRKVT